MLVEYFISKLNLDKNLHKTLLFQHSRRYFVPNGYHLTEIKQVSIKSVDCGENVHNWNETILQIGFLPNDINTKTEENITVSQFLTIWKKVSKGCEIDTESEIKFEYGDENFITAVYSVVHIDEKDNEVIIRLMPPSTQCKPHTNRLTISQIVPISEVKSCCASSTEKIPVKSCCS